MDSPSTELPKEEKSISLLPPAIESSVNKIASLCEWVVKPVTIVFVGQAAIFVGVSAYLAVMFFDADQLLGWIGALILLVSMWRGLAPTWRLRRLVAEAVSAPRVLADFQANFPSQLKELREAARVSEEAEHALRKGSDNPEKAGLIPRIKDLVQNAKKLQDALGLLSAPKELTEAVAAALVLSTPFVWIGVAIGIGITAVVFVATIVVALGNFLMT